MTSPVPVVEADREAAAAWAKSNSRHAQAANMRRGSCDTAPLVQALARHRIASTEKLVEALKELADVFALDGESSVERFERLAAMFRKDTGYLAPGKDQPMCGPDQPDGDELRAIYDAWYQTKIDRARAALSEVSAS